MQTDWKLIPWSKKMKLKEIGHEVERKFVKLDITFVIGSLAAYL